MFCNEILDVLDRKSLKEGFLVAFLNLHLRHKNYINFVVSHMHAFEFKMHLVNVVMTWFNVSDLSDVVSLSGIKFPLQPIT